MEERTPGGSPSMSDIIYIGYDVINIVDVMSYLYGCDIIKCSCDAMHTE